MELLVQTWIDVDDDKIEELIKGRNKGSIHSCIATAMNGCIRCALKDQPALTISYVRTSILGVDCDCEHCKRDSEDVLR